MTAQPSFWDQPAWPEAPRVTRAEQRDLAVERESVEARFRRWRATADGQEIVTLIRNAAITRARLGEQVRIKGIAEEVVRGTRHRSVNNSHLAWIARELVETEPELKGVIELREAKSARGVSA